MISHDPVRLTPVERFVLGTCSRLSDRLAVIRSARTELNFGRQNGLRHSPANMFRHVLLVGLIRRPVFYTVGPIVAASCYLYVIYKAVF